MKIKKQVRQVFKALGIPRQAISRTRGGHLAIKLRGCTIFTSSTPSDRRGVKNLSAQLSRVGVL